MTRRPLISFGFFKYPAKKKKSLHKITTILRDEYKIEDMMVIVTLCWTRLAALAGFVQEAQNVQEVITLEVNS